MSTKTLRKRIALVAVMALGAGLLSVAPANASAGTISAVGGTGILGKSTSTAKLQTATMLTSGTLALTSTPGGYYVVSAGGYVSALLTDGDEGDTTPTTGIDADQSGVTAGTTDVIKIRATGAAGSTFTVTGYASDASTLVVDKVTVTIAAASVAGTAVAANSIAVWTAPVSDGDTITTPTMSSATDSTNASTTTGKILVAQVQVRDAYKNTIKSASTAITATASAGAVVKIVASNDAADTVAASTGTGAVAVASAHAKDVIVVTVAEATAGAGWSGTLTVNYKGTDVAVKTGKISGDVAKLTALSTTVVSTSSGFKGIAYNVTDAAGNLLSYTSSNIALDSSSNTSVISGITVTAGTGAAADTNLTGDVNARSGNANTGTVTASCSLAGSSTVVLRVINDSGKLTGNHRKKELNRGYEQRVHD
jgi:trimeric autotransporter adhesin